jgi:hypothetical protein
MNEDVPAAEKTIVPVQVPESPHVHVAPAGHGPADELSPVPASPEPPSTKPPSTGPPSTEPSLPGEPLDEPLEELLEEPLDEPPEVLLDEPLDEELPEAPLEPPVSPCIVASPPPPSGNPWLTLLLPPHAVATPTLTHATAKNPARIPALATPHLVVASS